MHEYAIATAVLDVVERHAGGRAVRRVDLRVGQLRQVVPDSLAFAWRAATRGTCAEGSELHVDCAGATVRCLACGARSGLEAFPARCPACASLRVEVTGGDELLVESLDLDEEEALRHA
jgi:hydrogenase nickel incorporation protein HypA/HybF